MLIFELIQSPIYLYRGTDVFNLVAMNFIRLIKTWARLIVKNPKILLLLALLIISTASLVLADPGASPLDAGDGDDPIPINDPYGG